MPAGICVWAADETSIYSLQCATKGALRRCVAIKEHFLGPIPHIFQGRFANGPLCLHDSAVRDFFTLIPRYWKPVHH